MINDNRSARTIKRPGSFSRQQEYSSCQPPVVMTTASDFLLTRIARIPLNNHFFLWRQQKKRTSVTLGNYSLTQARYYYFLTNFLFFLIYFHSFFCSVHVALLNLPRVDRTIVYFFNHSTFISSKKSLLTRHKLERYIQQAISWIRNRLFQLDRLSIDQTNWVDQLVWVRHFWTTLLTRKGCWRIWPSGCCCWVATDFHGSQAPRQPATTFAG